MILETIKSHYKGIRAAEIRVAGAVEAAKGEIADATRHIEALTAGLYDEEKAKLAAWLQEHEKGAPAAK